MPSLQKGMPAETRLVPARPRLRTAELLARMKLCGACHTALSPFPATERPLHGNQNGLAPKTH